MDEPWQIYYEELMERAEDIPDQRYNRDEDMAEAAHETHEATVDRLVNRHDVGEPEALELTKAFGTAVKEWIRDGTWDFDELADMLEKRQEAVQDRSVASP